PLAVAAERGVVVLAVMGLAPLFGLPGPLAAFAVAAQGIPGVILLVTVVPFLVGRLEALTRSDHGGQ
ncbi:MAG: hypothetical protein AB1505_35285, partial [Candidatus Latescibacterota bacterium]